MFTRQLNGLRTVEALDDWAAERNVADNEAVQQRRLQLTADNLNRRFNCLQCESRYKYRKDMLRHQREKHGDIKHQCSICTRQFTRLDHLKRHQIIHNQISGPSKKRTASQAFGEVPNGVKKRHAPAAAQCNECLQNKDLLPGKKFCQPCSEKGRPCKRCQRPLPERFYTKTLATCDSCFRKREQHYSKKIKVGGGSSQSALKRTVLTEEFLPSSENLRDVLCFFSNNKDNMDEYLSQVIEEKKGIKWSMMLTVRFTKQNQDGDDMQSEPAFNSTTVVALQPGQIAEQIESAFNELYKSFEKYQREGSGWVMDQVVKLEVKVAAYTPIIGSSYIRLPAKLLSKKAIVNIQNKDQECFKWSVLAALFPVKRAEHANRVSKYATHVDKLEWSMLQFPTPLSQISKFEEINSVSVNIFAYEDDSVFPLHITKYRYGRHVNLLLITDGQTRHFCVINSMSRLLGDRTNHQHAQYYCNYCLHGFSNQRLLKEHTPYCSVHGPQRVTLPGKGDKCITFDHHANGLRVPYVIYCDFESILEDVDTTGATTEKYQRHIPSGFCYTVISTVEKYCKPAVVYRGENVIDTFMEAMFEESNEICNVLSNIVPMKLSLTEESEFTKAVDCHICGEPLGANKVKDHDHLTGNFRGAAHKACNLQFKFSKENERKKSSFKIPIIFHNLRGYDSHFIMESIGKYKGAKPRCIANNMERYISISIGNLRFIDSLQFMNTSLENLVSNLAKESLKNFGVLSRHYSNTNQVTLLTQKGIYPYDYMTNADKFEETSLPAMDDFYSKLNKEDISPEQYRHAQKVWKAFNIKNMGEYHDLYMKTDVLLLADVFENFRDLCIACYQLDPAHYYTSPGLAWDAMLKRTKVELELITDYDKYLMFEAAIRGGISMISNKYARANNKYLHDFNPEMPSNYIIYLDANNLYGWAMSQCLPTGNFDWLTSDQIEQLDVKSIRDDQGTGYILEVDLEYPTSIHDDHSDYPLAPDTMTVTDDLLSARSLTMKENLGIKGTPSKKLVPNLFDKTRYILHYRNLQLYMRQGMRLRQVHRVISFDQSTWLKSYIDSNTEKRMQATSTFEKDFYKLMNNSVFGKTIENLRKRTDIQLVNDPKRMKKLCAKPSFKTFKIFNEHLTGVHMEKTNLVLNRPIYVGAAILDLSKTLMYEFHYNYIKSKYGSGAKLLFTDTDSLCYQIQTDDIYRDMHEDKDRFDTSDYNTDHFLHSATNKKVIGKMKDECAGKPVKEFVGLRSKMYSLLFDGNEKKAAAGVKRSEIKKLRHDEYRGCIFNNERTTRSMNTLRSYNHKMYSVSVKKIALSPFDDKRHVLKNGHDTLAHGHYKIR